MNRIRIPVIIACLFLSITPLHAQTVVSLSPVAKQQFFSATGVPLATGCVNTYTTGTSTPLATYTDSTGATPNSNPIILDAGGFANVWLSNASYRFVVVAYDGIPGNKCAAGVTQYTIDGINAFAAISTGSNLFLLGQSSDPAGTAGEMVYRTDIPCFRFFTTFWDCVVRLTDTQTLTNKTLTSPTITAPTINGVSTGTGVQGTDTKLASAGTISSTPGTPVCSDANAGVTTSGCVTSIQSDLTGQTANIAATTLTTPAVNGFYRFSCLTVDTQAATTSSTLPSCTFTFTQADTGLIAASLPICVTVTTNQVGDSCLQTGVAFMNYFYVKGGAPIKYFTSNYASSGATALAYAVHVRLEGPF